MNDTYNILDDSGYTSTIYSLPDDPPRVCKSFNKFFGRDCAKTHFPIERQAYERFSTNNHPSSILKYYGVHADIPAAIILELAEKSNLYEYYWLQKKYGNPKPEPEVLYHWASQAAEALEFAHSVGVYNSDIHPINFFLDHDLNLKVGDWAGASIDGAPSASSYRLKYSLFDANGTDVSRTGITANTEIFALGTALYFMVTGQEPWPELCERENSKDIKKRIQEKQFPDTSALRVLGGIIHKCWNLNLTIMTEVKHAIEAERHMYLSAASGKGVSTESNSFQPEEHT